MHITVGEVLLYIICIGVAAFWVRKSQKKNPKQQLDDEKRKRGVK